MNPYTAKKFAEASAYAPHSGPNAATNLGFHDSYNVLIRDTLSQIGQSVPVMVMIGDNLNLLNQGETRTKVVIPELYHHFKSLAHSAFGLQLWFMAFRSREMSDDLTIQLQTKRQQIENSLAALDWLPTDSITTPTTLLSNSISKIEQVLDTGMVEPELADGYARWIGPHVLKLAAAAVRLEIDGLHHAVSRWRAEVGDVAWHAVHIVLCGNHQPRYRHAANQYFERLLGEHAGIGVGYEDRIVFAENVSEIDGALDLLARHIVDQQASLLIFGDKSRLQRDLLADVATTYLDEFMPLDDCTTE